MRAKLLPAGVVIGLIMRRHVGLSGVGVFEVPAGQISSPPSVSSSALVQSGSGLAPPKSIFPSPSLSIPSLHSVTVEGLSLLSSALVQSGSATQVAHGTFTAGEKTSMVTLQGLYPLFVL